MKKLLIIIVFIFSSVLASGQTYETGTVISDTVKTEKLTADTINARAAKLDSITSKSTKIGNSTAYVLLDEEGVQLIDTATQWNDLVITAALINPAGNPSPPSLDNTDGTYLFAANAINTAVFIFQMPHSWKQGTNVSFHIHASKNKALTGNPLWRAKYRWVNLGDTATSFTAYDTLTLISVLTDMDVKGQHLLYDAPDYNGTGKTFSSILIVFLERTGTAASDDFEDDMKLYSVDVHYQIEAFGSKGEYRK